MARRQTKRQTGRQTTIDRARPRDSQRAAISLRIAIARTARRLRQEGASDLSPTALSALATINRRGPVTPTDLAGIEGVKRPTATRVIGRLLEAGLIERVPDPDDGRSSFLSTTMLGSAYLNQLRSRKTAFLADLLESLPPEDASTLERALEILDRALEEPGS